MAAYCPAALSASLLEVDDVPLSGIPKSKAVLWPSSSLDGDPDDMEEESLELLLVLRENLPDEVEFEFVELGCEQGDTLVLNSTLTTSPRD